MPSFLRRRWDAAVVAVLILAPLPSFASRADDARPGTIVTFTERAQENLPRDRLDAEMTVEATNSDPVRLQDAINRRMTAALAAAGHAPAVLVTTGGYSVYEEHPDKRTALWHGRQALELEAGNQAALLALVGTLQGQGLLLKTLAATVSPDARRAAEDRLTDAALARVKARADKIAAALGLSLERFRSLQVGSVAAPPIPVRVFAATAMAQPAVAPPVSQPGTATVSVGVTAEIELGPPH